MITHKKTRASYPDGVLGIYDNRGRTIDRYCVVFSPEIIEGDEWFTSLSMSRRPCHPQGVGITSQHRQRPAGAACGIAIQFADLPDECQRCVEDFLAQ